MEKMTKEIKKSEMKRNKLLKIVIAIALLGFLALGYLLFNKTIGVAGIIEKGNTSEIAKRKYMRIVDECKSEGMDIYYNDGDSYSEADYQEKEENYMKFLKQCIEERNKNPRLKINFDK